MRPLLATLVLALSGCCADTGMPPFSPHDVVAWARLDESLGGGRPVVYGKADGKAVLGGRVLALNGEELHHFVRRHGYAGHGEARRMRRVNATTLDVEVEIRGKAGATMRLYLRSDGEPQGRG